VSAVLEHRAHPDSQLVADCRERRHGAHDVLYERYYSRLVDYLSGRFGDRGLAEEVAQDVLADAPSLLSRFDASRSLWPWLSTVARNRAHNHQRKTRREMVDSRQVRAVLATQAAHDPDRLADRDLIREALSHLPPRQAAALVLRIGEDRSAVDTGELLGTSASAVDQLVSRGRRALRSRYEVAATGYRALVWPVAVGWRGLLDRLRAGPRGAGSIAGPAGVEPVLAFVMAAAMVAAPVGAGTVDTGRDSGSSDRVAVRSVEDRPATITHDPPASADPHVERTAAPTVAPPSPTDTVSTRRPVTQFAAGADDLPGEPGSSGEMDRDDGRLSVDGWVRSRLPSELGGDRRIGHDNLLWVNCEVEFVDLVCAVVDEIP